MTIKELKVLIADLPDDATVFATEPEHGEYETGAELAWFRWNADHGWWEMLHGKPRKPGAVQGVLIG